MGTEALLAEILISGFFAVACLRARAESPSIAGLAPRRLLCSHRQAPSPAPFALAVGRHGYVCWCSCACRWACRWSPRSRLAAQFIVFLALPSVKERGPECSRMKDAV